MTKKIIIGTRGSKLALWQANKVKEQLLNKFPSYNISIKIIKTTGDILTENKLYEMPDKGVFTKEIEEELLDGKIDIAVHSLKDMPVSNPLGLIISGLLKRDSANDVLVAKKGVCFKDNLKKFTIGCSSKRRISQFQELYPNSSFINIRGNIDTRINKVQNENEYDGTLLTLSSLERMGLINYASQVFQFDEMVPAPGQGIVCIQSKENNHNLNKEIKAISSQDSENCAFIERNILKFFSGSGCTIPLGIHSEILNNIIAVRLYLKIPEKNFVIKLKEEFSIKDLNKIPQLMINSLLDKGVTHP